MTEITAKVLGSVLRWSSEDPTIFITLSCAETALKIYTLYSNNSVSLNITKAQVCENFMARFNQIFTRRQADIIQAGVIPRAFYLLPLNSDPVIKINPITRFQLTSFINHLYLALSYPARITSSILIGKAAQLHWNGQDKGPIRAIVTAAFLALSAWNIRHTVIHELRASQESTPPTLSEIFNFPLKVAASHAAAVGFQYLWNRKLSGPVRTAALASSIVYFSFFNIFRQKGLQGDVANKVPVVSLGGKKFTWLRQRKS